MPSPDLNVSARPDAILYTVTQTAEALGVGRDAVYELIARDELPHIRLGERTLRVPRALLAQWVEARSRGGRS